MVIMSCKTWSAKLAHNPSYTIYDLQEYLSWCPTYSSKCKFQDIFSTKGEVTLSKCKIRVTKLDLLLVFVPLSYTC